MKYILSMFVGQLGVAFGSRGGIPCSLAAVFLGGISFAIWISHNRCRECGGTLFTWSYGKQKCNRDGDKNVEHQTY
jgi:hypothetical protein